MFRFPFLRQSIGILIGVGLIAGSGCKTQRVYLDDSPTWIQQATGQVDLGSGSGSIIREWQEAGRQEEEAEDRPSTARSDPSQAQPDASGPPRVEFGPPTVSVQLEGVDY